MPAEANFGGRTGRYTVTTSYREVEPYSVLTRRGGRARTRHWRKKRESDFVKPGFVWTYAHYLTLIFHTLCRGGALYFVLCSVDCAVTLSSTGAKNRFKQMTPATSGVLAGFPPLFPIRNPCELRGLRRRPYFGPRTCGGSITNVIEVGRVLNPGFPFSPLHVHFCVHPQTQRC